MADRIQKTSMETSTSQHALEKKDSFVRKVYGETIMAIGVNPRAALFIGIAAAGIAFYGGLKLGNQEYDVLMKSSRTIDAIQAQNIAIMGDLERLSANYETLTKIIEDNNKTGSARLATLEDKVQWKQAVEESKPKIKEIETKETEKKKKQHWWQF